MIKIANQDKPNKVIDEITKISFQAGVRYGIEKMCNNVLIKIQATNHLNPAKQIRLLILYIQEIQNTMNETYSNINKEDNNNDEKNTEL